MASPARPPKPTEIRSQPHLPDDTQWRSKSSTPVQTNHPSFHSSFLESRTITELQALLDDPQMIYQIYLAEHPQPREQARDLASLEAKQDTLLNEHGRIRSRLVELKLETENAMIETKELERDWETTELAMYSSLKPYNSSALYSKFQALTGEAEATTESLLSSFLDGVTKAEGEEIHDFVKEYRTARKIYHLRREQLARWKDGRVGGFR